MTMTLDAFWVGVGVGVFAILAIQFLLLIVAWIRMQRRKRG